MLTILTGKNTSARNARVQTLLAPKIKNGAEVVFYNDVNFSADALRASAESASLFGDAPVSVISGVGDNTAIRDELEKILPELAESQQQFIISENSLLADFKKRAEKCDAVLEEFDEKKEAPARDGFIFELTDAFSARKRSQAWALYRKAVAIGMEPREIHGKIFWAVKTMLIADKTKSAGDAGIKPFVYEKAKASSRNFAKGELEKMATDLTDLFHNAMLEGFDFECTLEAFILKSLAKPAV